MFHKAIVHTGRIKHFWPLKSINNPTNHNLDWQKTKSNIKDLIFDFCDSMCRSTPAHMAKDILEFTPNEILKLTDEEMRNCQIGCEKTFYNHPLASDVTDKCVVIERFDGLETAQIRK